MQNTQKVLAIVMGVFPNTISSVFGHQAGSFSKKSVKNEAQA